MSPQVSGILMNLGIEKLETQFAIQCAPVVTGVKISNLFIVPYHQEHLVREIFRQSGLHCYLMSRNRGRTTFLLYRKEEEEQYLQNQQIKEKLQEFGYETTKLQEILPKLRERYERCVEQRGEFPHELGLILGYPKEDVVGFIENKGQNFLYSGYWKVYAHPEEKKRLFQTYEEAVADVGKMIGNGKTMQEIIYFYRDGRRNHE